MHARSHGSTRVGLTTSSKKATAGERKMATADERAVRQRSFRQWYQVTAGEHAFASGNLPLASNQLDAPLVTEIPPANNYMYALVVEFW